jgi:TPR repeat protein
MFSDEVLKDKDRLSATWIKLAAEQQHPRAQHALSYLYQEGIGVPEKNKELSMLWLVKAAQNRHPPAVRDLQKYLSPSD